MDSWYSIALRAAKVLLTLTLAYSILPSLWAWYRIRHLPGPFWARFSRFWLVRQIYTGVYMDRLWELHKEYGPVVCLAPDFVAVSDPDTIRAIGNVRSSWGRGTPYFGFRTSPGDDSLFSQRDRRTHELLRKKLIGGYAGKDLIETKYTTSTAAGTPAKYGYRPIDFSRLAMYMTTDVISSFAFRRSFGCLERDGDFHGYLEATGKIAPTLVSLCAGADTTATAIRATMLYICTSPPVYGKLQSVIDEAVKVGQISRPISDSDAKGLPYLQAVVKEALRLFPPVGFMPRMSTAGEEDICGFRIPSGVNVEISIKTALRDKSIYGEDADLFRPER
ncbi:cytochrome P450 [Xylariales sp. PMI_506]|nr:cytochrome P450 [Xylariales sp. PMI_506]